MLANDLQFAEVSPARILRYMYTTKAHVIIYHYGLNSSDNKLLYMVAHIYGQDGRGDLTTIS